MEVSDIYYCQRIAEHVLQAILSKVLPWESLPVLRNHEIYRMPSFGSILSVILCRGSLPNNVGEKSEKPLRRGNTRHEKCTKNDSNACVLNQSLELPIVDLSDTFYLLNPSGDLSKTQATFEQWFRDQKGWQGKTGAVPSQDEFMSALQAHDLFIYFGHGSGEQYLPGRTIKRLDCRAAAILMGCSSGRLSSRGDYEPVGVPLSYLMAGCPSIIANLWDVTDGDIDRFSKVLLNSWVTSVSNDTLNQEICEGLQNLRITGKRSSRKESQKDQDGEKLSIPVRIGSFIAEGRSKCKLPYLIGASPVCYGVPTIIKPKRTWN